MSDYNIELVGYRLDFSVENDISLKEIPVCFVPENEEAGVKILMQKPEQFKEITAQIYSNINRSTTMEGEINLRELIELKDERQEDGELEDECTFKLEGSFFSDPEKVRKQLEQVPFKEHPYDPSFDYEKVKAELIASGKGPGDLSFYIDHFYDIFEHRENSCLSESGEFAYKEDVDIETVDKKYMDIVNRYVVTAKFDYIYTKMFLINASFFFATENRSKADQIECSE